ncbi:MAG TPA: hypothetical protein VGA37_08125 [Gemmatimonadales bacterium]
MPEWAWVLYPWMHLVGRILFAAFFVAMGLRHLAQGGGAPAQKALAIVSGLVILAGGLMVATGWSRFIGAGLLAIYLMAVALLTHAFWKEAEPGARANQMMHFLKNLALAGAALLIAYYSYQEWPKDIV